MLISTPTNRGLNIAVAGVPKTIDNDIALIDRRSVVQGVYT